MDGQAAGQSRLSEYITRRNLETFKHLHIIDEDALLAGASETELGRFLYASFNHHATVMGRSTRPRSIAT